jgi:hypothetical protein
MEGAPISSVFVVEHIGEASENAPAYNSAGRKDLRKMITVECHSTFRVVTGAHHMMLCLLLAFTLLGCAAPPVARPVSATTNEKNFSATAEQGVKAEHSGLAMEPVARMIASPIDPGASHVVEAIASIINAQQAAFRGYPIRISVADIRNQSRCGSDEYQALLDRIASQLNHAGREHQLEFFSDDTGEYDFHLFGTAYLITLDGFDVWEMFLSLSRTDYASTLWRAPGPVNVLRQERPSQPQIYLGMNW